MKMSKHTKKTVAVAFAVISTCDSSDIIYNMELYRAASRGEVEKVEKILESESYDINWQNCDGKTPLYIAAAWGHLEIVKLLIDHNADVNMPNDKGQTPLYVAASWGHVLLVKYLINHGATLDVKMKDGRTPLHIAAISQPHVNPGSSREKYWKHTTDFKIRMYKVAKDYMEEIMKSGQNAEFLPNIENDYKTILSHPHNSDISDSLMDIIVFYNHFATVVELVNAGAPLDIRDNSNETVFDKAKYSDHSPIISFLEKALNRK